MGKKSFGSFGSCRLVGGRVEARVGGHGGGDCGVDQTRFDIALVVDVDNVGGFLSLMGGAFNGWSGWGIRRSHFGSSAGILVSRLGFRKILFEIF